MNLHELLRIIRKAKTDEFRDTGKRDPVRKEHFSPAFSVGSDNGFHVILINRRIPFADRLDMTAIFKTQTDHLVVSEEHLGIGNQGRQQYCMCTSAFRTPDPADPETDISGRKFNSPFVVTMYRKAGGMPAGTGQLMELDLIDNRIIKRLRYLIAILSKNGYHGIVNVHRFTCV